MMLLKLLGTTGYHPNELRHTACFMIPEAGIVLDAGTGFFRVREHLATDTLDIFLSHAHIDHTVGLTYLFDVLWQKSMQHVRVHGAASHLQATQNHLFAPELFPIAPPCDWCEFKDQQPVSDCRVSYFKLTHPGDSYGFRFDWPDTSLAYITDTTAGEAGSYVDEIRGVDLLIHECYFPDAWAEHAEKTGHSSTSQVAQVAKAAAVKRLLLVHVNPFGNEQDPIDLAAAQQIFPNTVLGRDLDELEF